MRGSTNNATQGNARILFVALRYIAYATYATQRNATQKYAIPG